MNRHPAVCVCVCVCVLYMYYQKRECVCAYVLIRSRCCRIIIFYALVVQFLNGLVGLVGVFSF